MNAGMHSSKTAIAHKARVVNIWSPGPTPETFEKPKTAKFKDQTFTLVKKWKKIHKGNTIFKHPQHMNVNFTERGAKNIYGNKQEHFKLVL